MRPPPREPFSPYPLALLFAAFAVGILVAHFHPLGLPLVLSLAAGTSILAVTSLLTLNNRWSTLAVILAVLCGGAALDAIADRKPAENQIKRLIEEGQISNSEPVEVAGWLDRPLEYTPDGFYLTLRVESLRSRGFEHAAFGVVQLFAALPSEQTRLEYETLNLRYGARLRVVTALERADNYRNPGVSSLTEFLDRKGYDATGKLKSPLLLERLDDVYVFAPLSWLYDWRRKLEQQIVKNFPNETAGVLDASLLGNRYFLSREAAERFREGGTFHVLVISGLHISFIGGLVLVISRRLTRRRWLQFVLSGTVLWCYTLAVGAESSVVRSALMFTVVALAPLVARRANSLNALGGAGLFLLLWRPGELLDPSFQLTFLSVLAIVVLAVPLLSKLTRIGAWQPSREHPYPPACSEWLCRWCEAMHWSERKWRREMANSNYSYRLFKTPLAERLAHWHIQWVLRYVSTAVIVSISVQIGLLPFFIVYFHRLSIPSLLLNIFVSGVMAVLGLVALAGMIVAQLSAKVAAPLFVLAERLNWAMVHSVDVFDKLGVHSLRLPEYSGWSAAVYAIYYLPFAVLVWKVARWNPLASPLASRERWWLAATSQLLLLAIVVIHPLSAGQTNGRLRIDFLDVGQGDAALVTMPDGTTLLIDGGGRQAFGVSTKIVSTDELPFQRDTRSIGEAVVSEYLWWRGLDRVDFILATHADADHMDGLNDVTRNFKVRGALVARTPAADPEFAKFAASLQQASIPISVLVAGDVVDFGGATLNVYWPPQNANSEAPSANNDSIVLRLQYGQRTILMTGDIEREAEAALLMSGVALDADAVKVPHHGSKTSSTEDFVRVTHPRWAVISVGLKSIFGHPRPEVVERWKASGAEVITTGRQGTITISTDGNDLRVESFVK